MSLYLFSCHAKISVHHVSVGLHILFYCPFSCKTLFIFLTRSFLSFRPVELEKILSFHPTCVWHQQLLLALEITWPGLVILFLKSICFKWFSWQTLWWICYSLLWIRGTSCDSLSFNFKEMIRGRPAEWKQNHRMEKQCVEQIHKSCFTKRCRWPQFWCHSTINMKLNTKFIASI